MTLPALRPASFILGTPRSGTTLLRVMLAGHPYLFSPPEMVIAPFATMNERHDHMERRYWEKGGLRRALMELDGLSVDDARAAVEALSERTIPEVYALLQQKLGDRMLVDKCPHLCALPEALTRLAGWFPDARFVWIVRHPGSVIRSVENMPMAEVMLQGYADDSRDIWQAGNEVIRTFLRDVPADRWTMVRYEDLVADARPAMERVCAALGVPFHALVLDPYEGDRMREGPKGARAIGDPNLAGRGKIDPKLATQWLENFDPRSVSAATRALALELGYDLDHAPPPPIARVSDALAALWRTAAELEAELRLPLDIDAVEARRFLLRMIAASVDTFVEQNDPDRPEFAHAEGPTRKMFADCPDADYLRAPIHIAPGRAYRVTGRIPAGTLYVGALLYGKGGRIGAHLDDRAIPLDADRRFRLTIAMDAPADGSPWLAATGDENAVIVRQYYGDRARQPPVELSIALVGDPAPPAPLAAASLADGIERANRMVRAVFQRTFQAHKVASAMALNQFIEVPAEQLFPTPDNVYRAAWYRLGNDQVMRVRGRRPAARYFSLCLYNAALESLDYRRHTICLNHEQIEFAADGTFELVIGRRALGHPNWLDVAGHGAGYVIARWLLPEGDVPQLEAQVMYEKELTTA